MYQLYYTSTVPLLGKGLDNINCYDGIRIHNENIVFFILIEIKTILASTI